MSKIINLTPHSVTVAGIKIRPSRTIQPVRVYDEVELLYTINNIPVQQILTRAPDSLPPTEPGVLYIVSRLVADVCRSDRDDLVFPYGFQRNEAGRILGCHSLARFAK